MCVEFGSDHAARHAIEALLPQKLRYTDPDSQAVWEIRARPDRTLPVRLWAGRSPPLGKPLIPRLQARREFDGFALGGISKRGLLYARKDHVVRQLFIISEQGDGSSFLFAPRPGLATFGIDQDATAAIISEATKNLLV